jgi:hypothetical protein
MSEIIFTYQDGRFIGTIQCRSYRALNIEDGPCTFMRKCIKFQHNKLTLCIKPHKWNAPKVAKKKVIMRVRWGKKRLSEFDYPCNITADDLIRYFQTDTFYPDLGLSGILDNDWLVLHELVELQEIKRMGFRITKQFALRYNAEIENAHLKATEIECKIAFMAGDIAHLKKRLRHIKMWSRDSGPALSFRKKYSALYTRIAFLLKKR